eukprot:GHVU01111546.1.p1 GENE.GHVU01111546.1~~GHVU01111546.1.p1  ORF type:complete len:214 (+),score=28.10 GHVU01111546.1:176-817(+)
MQVQKVETDERRPYLKQLLESHPMSILVQDDAAEDGSKGTTFIKADTAERLSESLDADWTPQELFQETGRTATPEEDETSIEVSFCGGQERAGLKLAHLREYVRAVHETPNTCSELTNEATLANTLILALLFDEFDDNEKIKAIGKSVRDGTSSIFIKVDTVDGPTWKQLSLDSRTNININPLGERVQIVIAKNEGMWAARRGGRRVASMLPL